MSPLLLHLTLLADCTVKPGNMEQTCSAVTPNFHAIIAAGLPITRMQIAPCHGLTPCELKKLTAPTTANNPSQLNSTARVAQPCRKNPVQPHRTVAPYALVVVRKATEGRWSVATAATKHGTLLALACRLCQMQTPWQYLGSLQAISDTFDRCSLMSGATPNKGCSANRTRRTASHTALCDNGTSHTIL